MVGLSAVNVGRSGELMFRFIVQTLANSLLLSILEMVNFSMRNTKILR